MTSKARSLRTAAAVALMLGPVLAPILGGCSAASLDAIPTWAGGLPEGVPPRPATPPGYPAVHDMPPSRQDAPLSEAERKRLQEDLARARDRYAPEATGSTGSPRNP